MLKFLDEDFFVYYFVFYHFTTSSVPLELFLFLIIILHISIPFSDLFSLCHTYIVVVYAGAKTESVGFLASPLYIHFFPNPKDILRRFITLNKTYLGHYTLESSNNGQKFSATNGLVLSGSYICVLGFLFNYPRDYFKMRGRIIDQYY